MKSMLPTFIVSLAMLVVACAPLITSPSASISLPTVTPITVPAGTQLAVAVTSQPSGAIVETTSVAVNAFPTLPATADNGGEASSASMPLKNEVTFADNGKTFVMHVGESFLLNLGGEAYDWTVEVDNQGVIQYDANAVVPSGAQGIYIAQASGAAHLTATGDPLCRKSRPPCMRPSILFSITVTVQ
jgi:hypothetical protein